MAILKTYNVLTDITNQDINFDKINEEIKDSGFVTDFQNITYYKSTGNFSVFGLSMDESQLDLVVSSHEAMTIQELKEARAQEFRQRTNAIIEEGFIYNSKKFSLSLDAQTKIIAMKENLGSFTFPFRWTLKSGTDTYSLSDSTEALAFHNTALEAYMFISTNEMYLTDALSLATTKQDVDAIIDTRTL